MSDDSLYVVDDMDDILDFINTIEDESKSKILNLLEKGMLDADGDLDVIFVETYSEETGSLFLALVKFKESQEVSLLYSYSPRTINKAMKSITGMEIDGFGKSST